MNDLEFLKNLILAPYLLKSTSLIGVSRKVGANQFRHSFAVLGILLDYKYFDDSILLKAAICHDILEDTILVNPREIMDADVDGPAVLDVVKEVSRDKKIETKEEYLQRLTNCTWRAKVLKCADRIQNLTDLHLDTHTDQNISEYLNQTETYILPLAEEVNPDFVIELTDLIAKRRRFCK